MTATSTAVAPLSFLGAKTDSLPAFLGAMPPADKNMGNENVGADDQQIPRLNLLQALSPQLDEIEGAKAGLLHNSVTNELYTTATVINLFYKREFTIWRKRAKGGGYCGAFATEEAANAQVESLPGTATDYDITETAKHACLMLNPETGEVIQPVVIFFKGSGLSTSRNWNSQIGSMNKDHPRFATIWTLSTQKQTNEKGSWFNWQVGGGAWVPNAELYNAAKDFYTEISVNF